MTQAPTPPPATPDQHDQEPAAGLRLLRGTDSFLPEVQIVRDRLVATLREAFELHGFSPAETPIVHHLDLLASKYAGGAEILKETYQLTDQGGRSLALRYDLTVPFAMMVGMARKQLRFPFKRYEIGRVFRDGPVLAGRRREFYQCDADVVGLPSMLAEAELIALADMAFKKLGIEARLEINHRGLLSALIEAADIPADRAGDVILTLDKLEKIGEDKVRAELAEKGFSPGSVEKVMMAIARSGDDPAALIAEYRQTWGANPAAAKALDELEKILDAMAALGASLPVKFVPTLARGLEIYTGPVFEFFLQDQEQIKGSIAAGGRYDKIIGQFLENQGEKAEDPEAANYATVGFSFGLTPLTEHLLSRAAKEGRRQTVTEVVVVSMGAEREALRLVGKLRKAGVRTEFEMREGARMKKTLAHASAMGVPFVAILGENEVAQGVVALKSLADGKQESLSLEEVVAKVRVWTNRLN